MELKTWETLEFTNNWDTIDTTNDWTRANDHGNESLTADNGAIQLSGSNMGYNSAGSYDRITSNFDLSKYRLISFSCNADAYCYFGDSMTAALILTDGTNSYTLMSVSAGDSNSSSDYFGLACAGGFFTLEIVGSTVNIYRQAVTNAQVSGNGTESASASLVADAYALDISSWSSLNIRIQVTGDARSGYGSANGNNSIVLGPILASKKVIGSKRILAIPS